MLATLERDLIEGLKSADDVLYKAKELQLELGVEKTDIEFYILAGDFSGPLILAEGTPAKKGRDGELKFKVDVSAKARFVAANDQEKIDFKNAMTRTTVSAGDLVAVLLSESAGRPGKTVDGREIPCSPGKPFNMVVSEGIEQEKNLFFATMDGVPKFKKNKLSVDKVMCFENGVNLESGNVQSDYSLIIYGDVEEGFEVQSGGDIKIFGSFYGKKLKADGNIEIKQGAIGKEHNRIEATGRVEVKFAHHVQIIANEEVMVTKDVLHSKVTTLNTLCCNGSILGSDIEAFYEVEAMNMGSDLSGLCHVKLGYHYVVEEMNVSKEAYFEELNKLKDKYEKAIELGDIEELLKTNLERDISIAKDLRDRIFLLEKEIDILLESTNLSRPIKLFVHNKLYPDVELRAPHAFCELNDIVLGKVQFVLNKEKGCFEKFKLSY